MTRIAQRGYTLVEVLIVLFIISIVTSVTLLSINHNENKQLESFANELTQLVTLAEEQAILAPTVVGLSLNGQTVRFSRYQPKEGNKQKPIWTPFHDTALKEHHIPGDIQIGLEVNRERRLFSGDTPSHHPQIIISTNGDLTPFTIYIGKKGKKPRYAVIGDADGNVTNKLLS